MTRAQAWQPDAADGIRLRPDCVQRTAAGDAHAQSLAKIVLPTICTSGASRPSTLASAADSHAARPGRGRRAGRRVSSPGRLPRRRARSRSATRTTLASATPPLIERRSEELQDKAFALGERLYADKPKTFVQRTGKALDAVAASGAVRHLIHEFADEAAQLSSRSSGRLTMNSLPQPSPALRASMVP